ncbi:MAG: hypothetical protein PHP45_09325 [Elusimicrobiales bacterium]|nr:hypothetical protein [Elusimicrobiales bacterium]
MDGWLKLAAAVMLSALFAGGNLAYAKEARIPRENDSARALHAEVCEMQTFGCNPKDPRSKGNPKWDRARRDRLRKAIRKNWRGDPIGAEKKLAQLDEYVKGARSVAAYHLALARWHLNNGEDIRKAKSGGNISHEAYNFATKVLNDAGEDPKSPESERILETTPQGVVRTPPEPKDVDYSK